MKNSSVVPKKQTVKGLQGRVEELQSQLTKMKKVQNEDESIRIKVQKTQARFLKLRDLKDSDVGRGEFFFLLDITALKDTVYVPLSIASGKKATGFVYHFEGTAEATIFTTKLSCTGEGVTKITLGTLLYAKIPALKTGSFRVFIEMRGRTSKEYKAVINRINYKLSPQDARYKRYDAEIGTKAVKFL